MIPLDFLLTAHLFFTDDRSLYYLRIYQSSLVILMNLIYQRGIHSFANLILSSRDVFIYSFRHSQLLVICGPFPELIILISLLGSRSRVVKCH